MISFIVFLAFLAVNLAWVAVMLWTEWLSDYWWLLWGTLWPLWGWIVFWFGLPAANRPSFFGILTILLWPIVEGWRLGVAALAGLVNPLKKA